MRKLHILLASLVLFLGLAIPAQGTHVFGNLSIESCSGPVTCWGVRGVAASVAHTAYTLDPNSVVVSSVYLYDPVDFEFVEAGVYRGRTSGGTYVNRFFVATGDRFCGASCYFVDYEETNSNFGAWRILLYRLGGTGVDDFRIQWDEPGQARQTVDIDAGLYYPNAPQARYTAEQHYGTDPFPVLHDNAWVQSNTFPYDWFAANGTRALDCVSDNVPAYYVSIAAGSGSQGDDALYFGGTASC